MNLVIIGNGFDLAHDMPTSYSDFKAFLIGSGEGKEEDLERLYPLKSGSDYLLWSDFEESLAHPSVEETQFVDDEFDLDPSWVLDLLSDSFCKWIEETSFAGASPLDKEHPYSRFLKPENEYLTFNYTELLEVTYGFENVLHIHGRPVFHGKETKQGIVFGHGSTETNDKYVAITEKRVSTIIEQYDWWFRSLHKDIDEEIVVIGFSCNLVDQPYLKRIREALPKNKWHFFYHSSRDKEKIEQCAASIGLSDNECCLECS